jgi:hypothetical protein
MRMSKIYWEARIAIVVALTVVAAVVHALWQSAPPTKNMVDSLPIVAFKHERIELARDEYANYVAATQGRNDLTLQLYCGDRLYALQDFTGPRHAELVMFDGTQWRAVPAAPGWILFVTTLGCRDGHVISWGVQGDGGAAFTQMAEFDITAQRATGQVATIAPLRSARPQPALVRETTAHVPACMTNFSNERFVACRTYCFAPVNFSRQESKTRGMNNYVGNRHNGRRSRRRPTVARSIVRSEPA